MHKQSLNNKICVVTGAAQNIGLGIATACIEAGATVIMLDHNEALVSSEANKLGDKAFPMVIDLRDSTACDQIIKDIEEQYGRIDVAINNAYKGYYQSLEKLPARNSSVHGRRHQRDAGPRTRWATGICQTVWPAC